MNIDQSELERTIGDLLDCYKVDAIERVKAINEIVHLIQAVSQADENEFLTFIRSHQVANDG